MAVAGVARNDATTYAQSLLGENGDLRVCAGAGDEVVVVGAANARGLLGRRAQIVSIPELGLVITGEVRIDNSESLYAACLPRGACDLTLLAHGYLRWGADWPDHITGDYAVIIWDFRNRTLHSYRDAAGVRSLYYRSVGRGVAIATDARVLARLGPMRHLDSAHVGLLLLDSWDEETTWFSGVSSLPPGHCLKWSAKRTQLVRFWHPEKLRIDERGSSSEFAQRAAAALHSAVRSRIPRSGVVGVDVSGGLDSTTIAGISAAICRDEGIKRPIAFTQIFPELATDEERLASEFARFQNLKHVTVDAAASFASDAHAGFAHPTLAARRSQLKRAQDHEVWTTLSGLGADQLMHRAPSEEFVDAIESRRWNEFLQLLLTRRMSIKRTAQWWLSARFPAAPSIGARLKRQERPPWLNAAVFEAAMSRRQELRRQFALRAFETHLSRHYAHVLENELSRALRFLDEITAEGGGDYVHPFLDRRVVELFLCIPQSVRAGSSFPTTKPLLRIIARRQATAPASITEREDFTYFDEYIAACMRLPRAASVLECRRLAEHRLVEPNEVCRLLQHPGGNAAVLARLFALETLVSSLEFSGDLQ